MAVSNFKRAEAATAATSGSTVTEFATPAASTWYRIIDPLPAGYHRIKLLVAGNYYLSLYNKSTGVFVSSITVTSSDQFFTTTVPTIAYIWGDVTPGRIQFEQNAPLATSIGLGTLTRINSSQSYTANRGGFALALGGGGGGGGSNGGPGAAGQAGGAGGVGFASFAPGTYSIVIGSGGNGRSTGSITSGGTSSFGNINGNGGSAGFDSNTGTVGASNKANIINKPFGVTNSDEIAEGGSTTSSTPRVRPANSGCGGDARSTNGNASALSGGNGASGSVWVLELP